MPEDASEMYLSLLRRVLSGTNGRNLIDIAFSIGQVETGEEHALLQALRKSGLRDDEVDKKAVRPHRVAAHKRDWQPDSARV